MNELIMVVEDDTQIRNFIAYTLEQETYRVIEVNNGTDAIKESKIQKPDLILLDLGLPDIDGMEVLHEVRTHSQVPVIIVSARDQDKEKATALDDGADDYLTKPFSATELLARIRVALRHYHKMQEPPKESALSNGKLYLDPLKHLVMIDGVETHFTPLEFQLLALFMNHTGKVLTYHTIIHELWGSGYGNDTQALRALMAGIRRKIELNPAKPEYIKTEMGVGYRMQEH